MPDNIYRPPPWRVDSLVSPSELGEIIDWGHTAANCPEAWLVTKGEGVNVGIGDTGIQADHPDLLGQLLLDPADGTGSPFGFLDRQGHGTHVAGIVGANENQQGVIGVAPKCKLIVAKVLGDDGSGTSSVIAQGIDWMVSKGAHIINLSLGSPYNDPKMASAIGRATAKGVFVICAAGNSGAQSPDEYPAADRNSIAVAAINEAGKITEYSSRGKHVMFAAPGDKVLSTFITSRYARLSGTSMASPFLTGLAVLLIARHIQLGEGSKTPLRTRDELIEHLRRATVDIGEPGHDPASGWGAVDAAKLIGDEAPEPPPPLPVPPPAVQGVTIFVPGGKVIQGT